MKKALVILLNSLFLGCFLHAQVITIESIDGNGAYATVNGIELYYEVFGTGEPLLILHGNGGSVRSRHSMIPALAEKYRVIGVDSRCHGQSNCPNGDLTYQDMAEDIYILMEQLGHDKYTIWGHSDGGIIGLILGYKHPELIKAMLISGANIRPDSTALLPELVRFVNRYDEITDPRLRKQIKLMALHPNIPLDRMKEVSVPVLLMVGDRDAVQIEHTLAIFRALPKANLCILPGTSHFVSHERPDQVIFWLEELKQPFRQSSTLEIAREMAGQLFKN